MANHDFSPTANFTFEEPGVFRLRALRDLEAGEEVSGSQPRETDAGSPLEYLPWSVLVRGLRFVPRHAPGLACNTCVERHVARPPCPVPVSPLKDLKFFPSAQGWSPSVC